MNQLDRLYKENEHFRLQNERLYRENKTLINDNKAINKEIGIITSERDEALFKLDKLKKVKFISSNSIDIENSILKQELNELKRYINKKLEDKLILELESNKKTINKFKKQISEYLVKDHKANERIIEINNLKKEVNRLEIKLYEQTYLI